MAKGTSLKFIRARMLDELAKLDAEDSLGQDDQGTVILDQQSVGRLSRMDALQRQAMAQATRRRRESRRESLRAALKHLEDGEFGICENCGEEIPLARLNLDPSVSLCISCASS